jgi:hypothetical protein
VTAPLRALVAALALAGGLAGCGLDDRIPEPPGSTLRATITDPDGNGDLDEGPGEELVDRTELAPRGRADREVARLGQVTDAHVRDEESPARVPFLDRLGAPLTSTFRPHEALSAQVLTAAVRSLNAERPQGVLVTGDLLDNAQANEARQLVGVLEGGVVDPGSGRAGYRGVQNASNPDGFFYRPGLDAPQVPNMLTRAQREFFSPGLRAPWFPALGNHDLLVQGELPPSPDTDAIATGGLALLTFDPELEALLDELPGRGSPARRGSDPDLRGIPRETIDALLADGVPGRTTRVPSDPERRHLRPAALIARLRAAAPLPAPATPDRLDYAADVAPGVRAIVLDTVVRAGGAGGEVVPEQVRFLRRALGRAGDRAIVVVSHHGLHRSRGGAAAQALLDGDGRVVAELAGDTHRHAITPVRTSAGGYWRIVTASLADWPQQTRMLRLVTGRDGARALETWTVDHAGGLGTKDLPGAARTLSFLDAQGGRPARFASTRRDRNARLWLPPRR